MLYATLLSITRNNSGEKYRQEKYSLPFHIKNNAMKGSFIISTPYKLLKYLPKSRYISKNMSIFASLKVSN
jgi:hypothetical protein